MYPLILYNALTDGDQRRATHERVMVIAHRVYYLVAAHRESYDLQYAQGIIMHPLVVVSYSLISRLEDPRSQPLLEQCLVAMLEMVSTVTVLKAVVHIYALAARKAKLQWSAVSGLDTALAKIIPNEDHCADYPVLGRYSDLIMNDDGDGGSAGITELLEQWKTVLVKDGDIVSIDGGNERQSSGMTSPHSAGSDHSSSA